MKIFAGAGEPSGDHILSKLLSGLRERLPDLELQGFGGSLCAAQGLQSLFPMDNLAMNGVADVLKHLPYLTYAYARIRRALRRFHPDLVLLVDYPGMNVGLARMALQRGYHVHYVAPPQLWAYRNPDRRLIRLQKSLQGASLQVLFPFEKEKYAPWARRLTAGHFFSFPSETRTRGNRLLLCPGSRRNVLRRNLPLWLKRLEPISANLDVLVPPTLRDEARRLCRGFSVEVVIDPEVAYARAARAIAFPGTMTLELFLRRIPALVWGIVDPLTLWSGKRALHHAFISLPNLLLEKFAFPEWVGTPRDFMHNPPDINPDGSIWNLVSDSDWISLAEKIGPSHGVEVGVNACLEMFHP